MANPSYDKKTNEALERIQRAVEEAQIEATKREAEQPKKDKK